MTPDRLLTIIESEFPQLRVYRSVLGDTHRVIRNVYRAWNDSGTYAPVKLAGLTVAKVRDLGGLLSLDDQRLRAAKRCRVREVNAVKARIRAALVKRDEIDEADLDAWDRLRELDLDA